MTKIKGEGVTQGSFAENTAASLPSTIPLEKLEQRYGVDLTASKRITSTQKAYVQDFGNLIVNWVAVRGVKKPDEIANIRKTVNRSIVLTHENHRAFAIAVVENCISALNQQWENGIVNMTDDERALALPTYQSYLTAHQETLEQYSVEDSPVASTMTIDLDNEPVDICLYSDWENKSVYEGNPLEAAIAEEVIHRAAKMHTDKHGNYLPWLYLQFEELVIQWYVQQALTDLGIDSSLIEQNSALYPGIADRWNIVIYKIGMRAADRIFFEGKSNANHRQVLWENFMGDEE